MDRAWRRLMAAHEQAVRHQYAALFAVVPTPTYLTYGNVDLPWLFPDYVRDGMTILDGAIAEIGGLTFGLVGGGLHTAYRTTYEVPDDDFARKVSAIGQVDVLSVTSRRRCPS